MGGSHGFATKPLAQHFVGRLASAFSQFRHLLTLGCLQQHSSVSLAPRGLLMPGVVFYPLLGEEVLDDLLTRAQWSSPGGVDGRVGRAPKEVVLSGSETSARSPTCHFSDERVASAAWG
jgi:hypothetical protein